MKPCSSRPRLQLQCAPCLGAERVHSSAGTVNATRLKSIERPNVPAANNVRLVCVSLCRARPGACPGARQRVVDMRSPSRAFPEQIARRDAGGAGSTHRAGQRPHYGTGRAARRRAHGIPAAAEAEGRVHVGVEVFAHGTAVTAAMV